MSIVVDEDECSFSCSIPGCNGIISHLVEVFYQVSSLLVFKDVNVFFSRSEFFYSLKDIGSILFNLWNIAPTFSEVIMHIIVVFVLNEDPFKNVWNKFVDSSS